MHLTTNHIPNIRPVAKPIITSLLSIPFLGVMLCILLLAGCSDPSPKGVWVGTWVTAPQLVEPHNMPPEPGLTNSTLRQVVRVSLGGDSLRIRFSNEFSTSPGTIMGVQIAVSTGGSSIDTSTIRALAFNGLSDITMEPGAAVVSDPISFDLEPRMDLAITIHFGETSPDVTGHPGSRTTSYLIVGNHLNEQELADAAKADRWYVINSIEVKAPERSSAIVVLGNSITDGRGSGTNRQNRWPDILSEHLLANPATSQVAVLNQGIGGNCVLRACLGPSALDRFERDVLNQSGVRWLIIFHGINDIGQTPDSAAALKVANKLITAYEQMIDRASAKGIKVYGATILPFAESFYDAQHRQVARDIVNAWIRTSGRFDAIIDFDMVMRNPEDTLMIRDGIHDGDFLHPNEEGYVIMGSAIDLGLFE